MGFPIKFVGYSYKGRVLKNLRLYTCWRVVSKIPDCSIFVRLLANRIEGYKTRRGRRCRGGQAITQGVSKNSVQTNGSSKKMCATDKKSS